jgi:lipoprotein-releasing system ATP-binding protein
MADLVVTEVTKTFPTRSTPLEVLRGVSLALAAGENLAVTGPSGCGKSTLLTIIGTLDAPTAGSVRLDGADPFALDEPRLAAFRNHKIGFVFQDHHLLPQCSVLENVLVPTLADGRSSAAAVERARTLLNRVGLAERLDHLPAELSGGERQRTAIARALVNRPRLLLADEPTGNLDRATAAEVAELLLDMQRQEQAMLIVVTHSGELAGKLQRRVELNGGRLEAAPAQA